MSVGGDRPETFFEGSLRLIDVLSEMRISPSAIDFGEVLKPSTRKKDFIASDRTDQNYCLLEDSSLFNSVAA
jgi:hypothetical protein